MFEPEFQFIYQISCSFILIYRLSAESNLKNGPPLPPKTYRHKNQPTGRSCGQLTVPSHHTVVHRQSNPSNGCTVQENLLRLINNVDSDNDQTMPAKDQQRVRPTSFIAG